MATGHRVYRSRRRSSTLAALPKEVTRLSTRLYEDRWGTEYLVVWNGLKSDPDLLKYPVSDTGAADPWWKHR